ncbi:MAG: glycosyltransferase [Methanobrevibacter sp.]|nr:glycosyltransferase [Methanobrevibacter sp.]
MISILMSCYKSNFEYLKEQIDSILKQTESDFELLIYNDGTDGLDEFLKQFCDERICWFDWKHLGYAKAYNFLLGKAKGDYICFCDHDDIWEPDKLEVEKKYLDEHPEVDCVFGWLKWFGEKEKLEAFSISDSEISKQLYFYQPIKQPTTMFRRKRFGEFDAPFDEAADFWFWAKHKDRHFHLIEKVMVNYRRHSGELTKDKTAFRVNSAKVIQESLKNRYGKILPLDLCAKLDKYSKTYNDEMKRLVESLL